MRRHLILLLVAMLTTVGTAIAEDVSIAVTAKATVRVEPFTAYYGQRPLHITGGNTSPMPLPNHIGCTQDTGVPVADALQQICAPATAYYRQIDSSGGNRCGYSLYAGVCLSVR